MYYSFEGKKLFAGVRWVSDDGVRMMRGMAGSQLARLGRSYPLHHPSDSYYWILYKLFDQ